ncbi:hypothetical protein CCMSSC00406_0005453 [Pleurotus cornucopiae]|uniref:Uncharacterized protein n=1 Tax=Pleurotus cornucopiae TaxID=5321 RepID=A0ACB7ISA8_PLECO|nr:hypothetical protein CCMSSC00406_0005453 [Pleurotus cornucopiae]
MAVRWSPAALLFALIHLYTALLALAADGPFDCHPTVGPAKYDLTSLKGEHTMSRTREMPPSSMEDIVTFDLCSEIQKKDGVPDIDQCPSGTQFCLTQVNKKADAGDDRVVAVIPIAQISTLNPDITDITSPSKGLSITLHGSEYPHPTNTTPTAQSMHLTLLCDPDHTGDPKFISYDGTRLEIEWSSSAGCPFSDDKHEDNKGGDGDSEPDKGAEESVGSGIGWFFLVLLLAFVAYFGVGAYYNYSTYGARGADLIP